MSHQYETIDDFKNVPWTEVVIDTRDFVVFKDGYPVTEGHLLFVPKVQDWDHLAKCYKAAYAWGYDAVQNGRLQRPMWSQRVSWRRL